MGNIIKRALLARALAPAFFAIPRWCQEEAPPKSGGEKVRAERLEFDIFKSRIQPIFLKHRLGHTRCLSASTPGPEQNK
jgi:hypothetical protein